MICDNCQSVGNKIIPEIIIGTNNVLIIGESPKGQLGDCLNTPTFKNLAKILAEINIKLSECSFTEICKCELKNRYDLYYVGQKCIPNLVKQIIDTGPSVVITLGVIANKLFANAYDITPGVGRLVTLEGFQYLPLWHTSPINPHGFRRNQQILSTEGLTLLQK